MVFALYREEYFGEKLGGLHSITPLFNYFQNLAIFKFEVEDKRFCTCNHGNLRKFPLGPLISLTTQNLTNSKGDIQISINSLFSYFSRPCPQCEEPLKTTRSVKNYPRYFFILLEICDEFNSLVSRKNFKDFGLIKLPLSLKINRQRFSLTSICYFQDIHYKVHVRYIQHPTLQLLNSNKWHHHDGASNGGSLIEINPKLEFKMREDKDLPYIVLYKH